MIGIIIAALSTRVGRAVVIGLGAAALFFSWLALHDHKVATKATDKLVNTINTQAERLADEAEKARAPAARSGAFARLRKHSCSDCREQ
jgi:hypothetical protein